MILDSCYAGKAAFKAKAYFEKNKDDKYLQEFKIFAHTNRYKKAVWGKYQQMRKSSAGMTEEKYKERQVIYEKEIGLTTFDSTEKTCPINELLP